MSPTSMTVALPNARGRRAVMRSVRTRTAVAPSGGSVRSKRPSRPVTASTETTSKGSTALTYAPWSGGKSTVARAIGAPLLTTRPRTRRRTRGTATRTTTLRCTRHRTRWTDSRRSRAVPGAPAPAARRRRSSRCECPRPTNRGRHAAGGAWSHGSQPGAGNQILPLDIPPAACRENARIPVRAPRIEGVARRRPGSPGRWLSSARAPWELSRATS